MVLPLADQLLLDELRRESLAVLERVLGLEREVALLDTPRHRNLGDSLIWAGTLAHLTELGHQVVHHSDLGRFHDDDVRGLPGTAAIVLSGGGNLGDRYQAEEDFRRHIVTSVRGRDIVVFPQTMHYGPTAEEARACADYSGNDRLTILLRDNASLERAREVMPAVATAFCPDAGLNAPVGPIGPSPGGRVAVIARHDGETAPADRGHPAGDWSFTRSNSAQWAVVLTAGRIHRRLPGPLRRPWAGVSRAANARLLSLNMEAASQQYRGARAVATNRLHGHILACLLGMPHYVADNSYGKVSRVFRDYSGRFSTAHLVGSLDEAISSAAAVTA